MSSDLSHPGLPDFVAETPLNDPLDASPDGETPVESSPLREGLPRGFRMRHDAHFVDQLDQPAPPAVLRMLPLGGIDAPSCADSPAIEALARSIREVGMVEPLVVRRSAGRYQVIAGVKRLSAARLAQLECVPCVVRDDLADNAIGALAGTTTPGARGTRGIDERPHGPFSSTSRERVLDDAIASLAAARTSVELTLPRAEGLRSRAAADLVRAELLNTRLALMAMRLLSAPPLIRRTQENPARLVEAVLADLAPVLRLSNARVTVTPGAECPPDLLLMRPLVTFAVEACVATVLMLAGEAADPSIGITVESDGPDHVRCSVRLNGGWLPAETARRLADIDWPGHPAGASSAMIAAAAESVAKLHDGTLDVTTDYEGFGITLTLRGVSR